MIFLELSIDGIYGFNDFNINFTYDRKSKADSMNQFLKKYPKIRYKKLNIILGSNASGKTTFGKTLCMISNYIYGKNIIGVHVDSNGQTQFEKMCEFNSSKNKPTRFRTVFYQKNYIYDLDVEFDISGVLKETWKSVEFKDYYTYSDVKKLLNESEGVTHKREDYGIDLGFKSPELSKENPILKNRNIGFHYSIDDDTVYNICNTKDTVVNHELRKKLLKIFDPSIKIVKQMEVGNNKLDVITFKSGRVALIDYNRKESLDSNESTLSSGTIEAIHVANMISSLDNGYTLYFDEKMVHSHHDLENMIIRYIIARLSNLDTQVFITTHNIETLNLPIPNFNFMIFKKRKDGVISTVVNPEERIKHNNRSLYNYIINDSLSTAPDTSVLEEMILNEYEK